MFRLVINKILTPKELASHANLNINPKYKIKTVGSFNYQPFQNSDHNIVKQIPQDYDKLVQSMNSDIIKDTLIKSQAGMFSSEKILENVQVIKQTFKNTNKK